MSEEIVKPKRGRPFKVVDEKSVDKSPSPVATKYKMKAKPNWDTFDPATANDTPDRLRIEPDMIPDGMSLLWVTDSVYGQGMQQHRGIFERKGWTPVHPSDFDGRFDGMFSPRGSQEEINVDGVVLMARPSEITDLARKADHRRAVEQVQFKERELRGGGMAVSLDARHPSALNSNKISKSMERLDIPNS